MSSLLAFHAHPDDESVSTGVTLAKYADEGHRVVVATATDGSAGEIHNLSLIHISEPTRPC